MEKLHLDYMRFAFNVFFFFKINQDAQTCARCKIKFSAYFCFMCKHFTGTDKNTYHCTKYETIFRKKFFVFLFVSWYSCFPKSKEVIGLLQYQVLPYEWKENFGASFSARATLNKRKRRPDRYAHETYHFQCFLIRLCEIVMKKYWAVLHASFCFLIGIRFPFIRSNKVEI